MSPMEPEWPPETSPSPSSTCPHTMAVTSSGRVGKGVSPLEPQSGSLGVPLCQHPKPEGQGLRLQLSQPYIIRPGGQVPQVTSESL